MRIATRGSAVACVMALALGCGSGSSGGGGGFGADGASRCPAACSAGAQACGWTSAEQSDCSTECSNELGVIAQSCSGAASSAFACAEQPSAWDCASGQPEACFPQFDALEDCQQQQGASLQPFCDKCAECVSDPSFEEGFCSPFAAGGSFDTAACYAQGDWSSIDAPNLSAAQLQAMTCDQFDGSI